MHDDATFYRRASSVSALLRATADELEAAATSTPDDAYAEAIGIRLTAIAESASEVRAMLVFAELRTKLLGRIHDGK